MNNNNRPIHLDLGSMRFPPMAIASILHRLSGLALFILLPYMLYLLHNSLYSARDYATTLEMLQSPLHKGLILIFMAALIYHLLAGIRHILMDIGFGEHLRAGRRSAVTIIILALILTILAGLWLC